MNLGNSPHHVTGREVVQPTLCQPTRASDGVSCRRYNTVLPIKIVNYMQLYTMSKTLPLNIVLDYMLDLDLRPRDLTYTYHDLLAS